MAFHCLFLFHAPLGAIRLKKMLAERQISYRVIDAPRKLTAECGVAVEFALDDADAFRALLNPEVCAVYHVKDGAQELVWRDEG